ncbi:hypothetical protein [Leisingera thetidis]|uniref:hypothetical protein n=1 Tax=Leisingera thetidis TaxID=2930199 RepID=UPI0021F75530|nr:hypothetical protein [Leisingera thetidis]
MLPDALYSKCKPELKDGLLSFSHFSSKHAVKAACVVTSAGLAACAPLPEPEPLVPAPFLEADRPAPRGKATRQVAFRSDEKRSGSTSPVIASCRIKGAEFQARFETPATLAIPVDGEGRAAIDLVSCKYGNLVAEWTGIPGTKTRWASVWFPVVAASDGKIEKGEAMYLFGEDEQVDFVVSYGGYIGAINGKEP